MKRYVLLEDKTIIDRNKAQEFSVYDREPIKLQSDNLIDLAEVGDCVEFKDDIVYLSEGILNGYKWLGIEKVGIVALWKRNGDIMRRYER